MDPSVNKPASNGVIVLSSDSSSSDDDTSTPSVGHGNADFSTVMRRVERFLTKCRYEAGPSAPTKNEEAVQSSSSSSDNFQRSSPETPRGSRAEYPAFNPAEENWKEYLQRTNFDIWTESSIKSLLRSSIKWDAEKESWKKDLEKEKKRRRKMQKELNELKKFVHDKLDPQAPLGPEESSATAHQNRRR